MFFFSRKTNKKNNVIEPKLSTWALISWTESKLNWFWQLLKGHEVNGSGQLRYEKSLPPGNVVWKKSRQLFLMGWHFSTLGLCPLVYTKVFLEFKGFQFPPHEEYKMYGNERFLLSLIFFWSKHNYALFFWYFNVTSHLLILLTHPSSFVSLSMMRSLIDRKCENWLRNS